MLTLPCLLLLVPSDPTLSLVGGLGSEAPRLVAERASESPSAPTKRALDWTAAPEADWLTSAVIEQNDPAAKDYKNLYRRFNLSLGGAAFANFDTTLQVSSSSLGAGTVLDLEDLLGVDDSSNTGRIDAQYSFNRRHRIDLSFYAINREGARQTTDDIQIGDVVIPPSRIESEFKTRIIKLAYRYNFVTDERTCIGASFGFHTMSTQASFESQQFAVDEEFRMTAPLPVLGLHGAYALSTKWMLSASLEVLQISFDNFSGFISDTRLTLDHDTFSHFGWGFGFNGFNLDGKADGNGDLRAEMEYGYQSVMLYLRMFF